jgi:hypothetical protein
MLSGVSVLESRLIEIHSSGPVSRKPPWLSWLPCQVYVLQIKCPLQVDIPKAKGSLLGSNSEQTAMIVPDLPLRLLNVILLNCWRRVDELDSEMFSYETIPSCRKVSVATTDPKQFPSSHQNVEKVNLA